MDDIVERAQRLITSIPGGYPITFVETGPGEAHGMPGTITGSFRAKSGQTLIAPIPESTSMTVAFPATIEFFKEAPEIISELLAKIEDLKAEM